ncbi:MAG: hypothetical protein KBT32_03150 [Bacteroidales bacterium]|nr:hypothetical protein [Candidatus Physcocola equi]
MRKELYEKLCERLKTVGGGAIKYIDLWNHNVEFIEQEENWERPAVFVEFQPIQWITIQPGVEYRSKPVVNLHVVTDWHGSSSADSELREKSLEVFDLLEEIHKTLAGMEGETFAEFDLQESITNHNHEDLVESIESYSCVFLKSL